MVNIFATTSPKRKIRRSAAPQPKYRIGQHVEIRNLFEDDGLITERGIVQGFAYLSPGYECMCASGSGFVPEPGFSYCILVNNGALTLENERAVFPVEVVPRG